MSDVAVAHATEDSMYAELDGLTAAERRRVIRAAKARHRLASAAIGLGIAIGGMVFVLVAGRLAIELMIEVRPTMGNLAVALPPVALIVAAGAVVLFASAIGRRRLRRAIAELALCGCGTAVPFKSLLTGAAPCPRCGRTHSLR